MSVGSCAPSLAAAPRPPGTLPPSIPSLSVLSLSSGQKKSFCNDEKKFFFCDDEKKMNSCTGESLLFAPLSLSGDTAWQQRGSLARLRLQRRLP
jgi:hypothetical protein